MAVNFNSGYFIESNTSGTTITLQRDSKVGLQGCHLFKFTLKNNSKLHLENGANVRRGWHGTSLYFEAEG